MAHQKATDPILPSESLRAAKRSDICTNVQLLIISIWQVVERNLTEKTRVTGRITLYRNLVHVAASYDRPEICDMLLRMNKVCIGAYYIYL